MADRFALADGRIVTAAQLVAAARRDTGHVTTAVPIATFSPARRQTGTGEPAGNAIPAGTRKPAGDTRPPVVTPDAPGTNRSIP